VIASEAPTPSLAVLFERTRAMAHHHFAVVSVVALMLVVGGGGCKRAGRVDGPDQVEKDKAKGEREEAAYFSSPLAPASPANQAESPQPITIRFHEEDNGRVCFDVVHLKAADRAKLARVNWSGDQWAALFAVFVDKRATERRADTPSVLGSYRVEQAVLRFEPRFPVERGLSYRAVFQPSRLPDRGGKEDPIIVILELPKLKSAAATVVQQVYPSGDQLPENHLRFYIQFSAPMSRGEAYRHVHLLDAAGKALPSPFLELDEELWDPQGKRFTLLFHPGRIKQGLKPREELGPILEKGKSYTLVIDRDWPDAQGNPMTASFRKSFRAGPTREQLVDPRSWKIQAPAAGSNEPLVVQFPMALDRALLERLISVVDAAGDPMQGTIAITDAETCWRFTPRKPWKAGAHHLVVDTKLEDSAGNSIVRQFEVDVFHPVDRHVKEETIKLPFQIQ
jgi:hypothetical protein